ncbi:WYL domain-containing protein [Mucilaginibacter sp. KACC 22773]|uniref:WYL domain-containing protein n=1 Tax=Mucilaginibacter sp. KACC 22773 TaxID=3025671 RepID=UPI0023666EED|nr:WYL domain-containing protein [Mucilaginibacter sp. KACC 22773]WDF77014.1 WYL domain-containing protein [Mucilaginibacter sp. KACC 22773]
MPKFLIGDIVTILSHPFTVETTDIVISGEYLMIPPIMVVSEIIDHSKDTPTLQDKFKCIWFSTKENQFKESYFSEDDLKSLPAEKSDISGIAKNSLVSLISSPLELSKRRSFLNRETQQQVTKNTSSIAGLLTFISPVMAVLEIRVFDKLKDKKTSPDIQSKKIYPAQVAKCKWFDSVSEKFSECWIPLECLAALPEVPQSLLALIAQVIKDRHYLKTSTTVVRPDQLSNRSGHYYLSCFDYVLYQNQTIALDEIIDPSVLSNPFKDYAPLFKKHGRKVKELKLMIDVEQLIEKSISDTKNNYLVIKYQDNYNNFTVRTISNYELIMGTNPLDPAGLAIKYVRAYCHLRQADRNFKLSGIVDVSVLDAEF